MTKLLGVISPELMKKVDEIAPSAEERKYLLEDLAFLSDEEKEEWLKEWLNFIFTT